MRTMKELNAYLSEISGGRLEIFHGRGYFWFRQSEKEFSSGAGKESPESIYVCYIKNQSKEAWKLDLERAVKEYDDQEFPGRYEA